MNRRRLLQWFFAVPLAKPFLSYPASTVFAAVEQERRSSPGRIDRRTLVERHCPTVHGFDAGSSLSVGNGSFCFTADATGLQTLPQLYGTGVSPVTQSEHLSPLPIRDGVYLGAESQEDYWQVNRVDHPSFLAAYGLLPSAMADRETMRRTLLKTLETWKWEATWGWDCGMTAMTATRLGEPELAVKALLMDTPKNHFSANGHSTSFRPCYLPANGSLLAALAMMARGCEGGPSDAPGFPKNGRWQVRSEGLRPML